MGRLENTLLDYRKIETETRARAKQVRSEYLAKVPQASWLKLDIDGAFNITQGTQKLNAVTLNNIKSGLWDYGTRYLGMGEDRVTPNQSLSQILKEQGNPNYADPNEWAKIKTRSGSPDLIYPGEELELPEIPTPEQQQMSQLNQEMKPVIENKIVSPSASIKPQESLGIELQGKEIAPLKPTDYPPSTATSSASITPTTTPVSTSTSNFIQWLSLKMSKEFSI